MPEDIYDAYGHLYMTHQSLRQAFMETLSVMKQLADGSLSTDDIEFTENGFSLREKETD